MGVAKMQKLLNFSGSCHTEMFSYFLEFKEGDSLRISAIKVLLTRYTDWIIIYVKRINLYTSQ